MTLLDYKQWTKQFEMNNRFKKDWGEVFTPVEMVYCMIDTLPHEVWKNPHLTWLEPTCGIGHFMGIVYFRLMDGLAWWQPSLELRRAHIIKNMLFMNEINEINVEICLQLFGPQANVFNMDFLEWNIDKSGFDIILGNLPFQSKTCHHTKNKLYEQMIEKCFSLWKPNGYLLLCVPDILFSGGTKMYKQLLSYWIPIIYLNNLTKQYFPKIQIQTCFFLLQNVKKIGTQLVLNDNQTMTISLIDRIINPIRLWNEQTEKLIQTHIRKEKNNICIHRGKALNEYLFEEPEGGNYYTLVYTPDKYLYTTNDLLTCGVGIKKIILFGMMVEIVFKIDMEGKYGVGPNTYYIPVKDEKECDQWIAFLESEEYRLLILSTKTHRQFIKNSFIRHLYLLDL